MTVIDLIIRLQQLPMNKEVMLDVTTDDMDWWKFVPCVEADEVTDSVGNSYVVLSQRNLEQDTED